MVYTGKGSFWFWGLENSGFGEGDNTTDTNQPPNKITEAMKLARPEYTEERLRTFDSFTENFIFTSGREPDEKTINWIFADPFFGLAAFTEKSVSGDWSSAGHTTISADFQGASHMDSIWLYARVKHYTGGDDLDKLLKGGKITGRFLVMEREKVVREELTVKFADMDDMDGSEDTLETESDFDDGMWADWDKNGIYFPWDAQLDWGGSEFQDNYGFKITSIRFGFEIPTDFWRTFDSLYDTENLAEEINPICEIEGVLEDPSMVDEIEKLHADKTSETLKLHIDQTTDEEKYDQFTNAYLAEISGLDENPKAGEKLEVTLTFRSNGGEYSLSYSYDDDNHADPGDRLNS